MSDQHYILMPWEEYCRTCGWKKHCEVCSLTSKRPTVETCLILKKHSGDELVKAARKIIECADRTCAVINEDGDEFNVCFGDEAEALAAALPKEER